MTHEDCARRHLSAMKDDVKAQRESPRCRHAASRPSLQCQRGSPGTAVRCGRPRVITHARARISSCVAKARAVETMQAQLSRHRGRGDMRAQASVTAASGGPSSTASAPPRGPTTLSSRRHRHPEASALGFLRSPLGPSAGTGMYVVDGASTLRASVHWGGRAPLAHVTPGADAPGVPHAAPHIWHIFVF